MEIARVLPLEKSFNTALRKYGIHHTHTCTHAGACTHTQIAAPQTVTVTGTCRSCPVQYGSTSETMLKMLIHKRNVASQVDKRVFCI